ncbi:hypothetical protein MPSEU_000510300 [Mayamaea pseudoterrestris]|nr:hypothetical protein MPSEU_000510300 [Mayamaea pseudoterrestris]
MEGDEDSLTKSSPTTRRSSRKQETKRRSSSTHSHSLTRPTKIAKKQSKREKGASDKDSAASSGDGMAKEKIKRYILKPCSNWDAMFDMLLEHMRCNNNDTRVNMRNVGPDGGKKLVYWVQRQRGNYRNHMMRPDHLARLESIAFDFGASICGGCNPAYQNYEYTIPQATLNDAPAESAVFATQDIGGTDEDNESKEEANEEPVEADDANSCDPPAQTSSRIIPEAEWSDESAENSATASQNSFVMEDDTDEEKGAVREQQNADAAAAAHEDGDADANAFNPLDQKMVPMAPPLDCKDAPATATAFVSHNPDLEDSVDEKKDLLGELEADDANHHEQLGQKDDCPAQQRGLKHSPADAIATASHGNVVVDEGMEDAKETEGEQLQVRDATLSASQTTSLPGGAEAPATERTGDVDNQVKGQVVLEPDAEWDAMLTRLLAYMRQFGNMQFFEAQTTDPSVQQLAFWVSHQRNSYYNYEMRPDHLERLERIGFVFHTFNRSEGGPDPKYQGCSYTLPEMDCEIATATRPGLVDMDLDGNNGGEIDEEEEEEEDDDNENGKEQDEIDFSDNEHSKSRNKRKAKSRRTSKSRNKRKAKGRRTLEPDPVWDGFFAELVAFKRDHGHTMVLLSSSGALGVWVGKQRQDYRRFLLRPDHLARLVRIGFAFRVSPGDVTTRRAIEATGGSDSKYDDCEYTIPEIEDVCSDIEMNEVNSDNGDDITANDTHSDTIMAKNGDASPSPSESYRLILEDDPDWNAFMARLVAYKRSMGDTLVPLRKRVGVDNSLAHWVHKQRKDYKNYQLRPDHLERLKRIDFAFHISRCGEPRQATGGRDPKYRNYRSSISDDKVEASDISTGGTSKEATEAKSDDRDNIDKCSVSRTECEILPDTAADSPSRVSLPNESNRTSDYNALVAEVKSCLPLPPTPATMDEVEMQHHENFLKLLEMLKAYNDEHGDTMVSSHSFGELGAWVLAQRQRLRKQQMNQREFQSLCELDFVWHCDTMRRPKPLKLDFIRGKLLLPPPKFQNVASDHKNPATLDAKEQSLLITLNDQGHDNNGSKSSTKSFEGSKLSTASFKARSYALENSHAMTGSDYENLNEMMAQFFRHPLVDEYACKPFGERHPELADIHDDVVADPIDMDLVLQRIEDRDYASSGHALDQICKVFDQALKVYNQPQVQEVQRHVSIMHHLKDYVMLLWQEFMLPSDRPFSSDDDQECALFEKRASSRRARFEHRCGVPLLKAILAHIHYKLGQYLSSGGVLDGLDAEHLSKFDKADILEGKLKELSFKLTIMTQQEVEPIGYTITTFYDDLKECAPATSRHFEKIMNRLDRFFWKIATPFYEACTRGSRFSSISAEVATIMWACDKLNTKPFYPSLCLGLIAGSNMHEDWHAAVTARNERKLPFENMRRLKSVRLKCERAAEKDPDSCFCLVEYLGTHQFGWLDSGNTRLYHAHEDANSELPSVCFNKRFKQETLPRAVEEMAKVEKEFAEAINSIYSDGRS